MSSSAMHDGETRDVKSPQVDASSAPSGNASSTADSAPPPVEYELVLAALPYIDFEYNDPALKAAVDQAVKDEANQSTSTPAELLAAKTHLKMPEFKVMNSVFWETECARLAAGRPQQPMDVTRYKCEAPKLAFLIDSKTGKPKAESALSAEERVTAIQAWGDAVTNAQTQLSHQTERLINLELLKKFGGMAWKSHNEHLQALQQSMDNAVLRAKKSIEAVNRKRKTDQLSAAPTLMGLEVAWYELVRKNNEIEVACSLLDADLKRLRTQAQAKGLVAAPANGKTATAAAAAAAAKK